MQDCAIKNARKQYTISSDQMGTVFLLTPVVNWEKANVGEENGMQERFIIEKGNRIDTWMRAWMDIVSMEKAGIHAFNKKRCQRELLKNLGIFGLEDGKMPDESLKEAWKTFTADYMKSCMESKMFRGFVFGIGKVKDEVLAKLMLDEIMLVTKTIPEALGLETLAAPLHDVMVKAFAERVENGEAFVKKSIFKL